MAEYGGWLVAVGWFIGCGLFMIALAIFAVSGRIGQVSDLIVRKYGGGDLVGPDDLEDGSWGGRL